IHVYRDHRDLHSFPTRRSSDLIESGRLRSSGGPEPLHQSHEASAEGTPFPDPVLRVIASLVSRRVGDGAEPAAAAMTGVGELLAILVEPSLHLSQILSSECPACSTPSAPYTTGESGPVARGTTHRPFPSCQAPAA